MEYFPQNPERDPAKLPGFLVNELRRLQQALMGAWKSIRFLKIHAEPAKIADGDVAYADGSDWQSSAGLYIYLSTAWERLLTSSGLRISEGSNKKMGTATLVAGAVTVSNTSVTANSRIFLTSNTDGGTPGWLRVSARSAGASFTITSSSGTDTSTVAWLIVEPQ